MSRATRRVWSVPLAAHAAVLLLVLMLAGAYTGSRSSFIPDEGGLIIQARMLARGDGWVEHPQLLHTVDPYGAWYPLDHADAAGTGAFAPLAKHPVYSLSGAALYWLGGVRAILVLSIVGGWAAAVVAAAIARRFDRRLAVPALWVAGLASPLFFDSLLALGHTIGAAFCGGAILALISSGRTDPGDGSGAEPVGAGSHRMVGGSLTVGLCLFLAALVRNEAVIFGVAIGLVSLSYCIRTHRISLGSLGVAALAGPYLARLVEHAMRSRILGGGAGQVISATVNANGSFLGSRWSGFFHTWLEPSHLPARGGDALILVLWVVVPFLVLAAIGHEKHSGLVLILSGTAIAGAVARLFVHPYVAVPGLLMAFPLLWAAAWVLRPGAIAGWPMYCLLVVGLYFVGVILSQYPEGGALEWGGRYLALGLPVLVPVALLALTRAPWRLSAASKPTMVASAVVVSLAFAFLAVVSLHHEKSDNLRLVAEINRVSRGQGSRPVVVSVVPWVGRLSWSIYDTTDMLYVPPADLELAAQRLRAAGVGEVTLVSFGDGRTDYATSMTGWARTLTENFTAKARYWTLDRLSATAGVGAPGS